MPVSIQCTPNIKKFIFHVFSLDALMDSMKRLKHEIEAKCYFKFESAERNLGFRVLLIQSHIIDSYLNSVMLGISKGNVPVAQDNIHCVMSYLPIRIFYKKRPLRTAFSIYQLSFKPNTVSKLESVTTF